MTITIEGGTIPSITAGWFLRAARESAGLSQTELAAALRIDRSTVRDAEADIRKPKPERVIAWAMACNVPPAWLEYHVDLAGERGINLDLTPVADSKPRRYPFVGGGVSPLSQSVNQPLTLDRRTRAAWELAA